VSRTFLLAAVLSAALLSAAPGPAVLFASGAPEGTRAIVDSGHAGPVRWMEFDDKRGLLFSSGDDGTVRVWDPVAGNLMRVLQCTQLATGRIAVNPAGSQLAVVVKEGTSTNYLAVWDWEKERQLFRLPLKEDPLFLRFSGLGTYILFGESSWQGLKIIRSSDGSIVPFHPEGFGIVGFAEMSRTEKTLMTYQVSGRISYWDIASGNQTVDVPTVPYLSGIRMSADRSTIVGFTSTDVIRCDAVTGAERGRAPLAGVISLDLSSSGGELTCIAGAPRQVSRWTINGDSLTAGPGLPALPQAPTLMAYGADALYFAGASDGLTAISSRGDLSVFGKDVVADLTGFDAARGRVALGSKDWVRIFSSDALDGSAPLTVIRTVLAANPFSDSAGLTFLSDGKLLAWGSNSAGSPALAALEPGTTSSFGLPSETPRAFVTIPSPFRAALTDLRAETNELIGIETGGTLRIADPVSGVSRFDARIPGAAAALRVSASEIIAGRNTTTAREGSLLRLNMGTGETVSIKGRNIFTYALMLDTGLPGRGPYLYTVGIDAARSTNLLRYDGPGFERETLLDTVAEEDLDASLSLDPDQHVLYATFGKDRAVAWDGQALRALTLENSVPRRLAVRGRLLFSMNKDSTVTVADAQTGSRRAQIALFTDGEWCVVLKDGSYAASTGGDLHVRVFADGAPVKATEDYRLRIDTR
jgi:WD40 repeat protein